MGEVWVDAFDVGNCSLYVGASGDPYLDSLDIGSFGPLTSSGNVYVDAVIVGTYLTGEAPPPPPPPPDQPPLQEVELTDARQQTKSYLETYLDANNITKDEGAPAAYAVIYTNPNYPIQLEFFASSEPVDLLFVIGEPESRPMLTHDLVPYGYIEHVPIYIFCIDKTGVTGTLLKWKAEKELRRITKTYPLGSQRAMERRSDNDRILGSTILYSTEFTLNYRRGRWA